MRKCRLCGAVIRRRAEYCRFCTARQDGTAPDAEPFFAGPGSPPPWLRPAPPAPGTAPVASRARASTFEPVWDLDAPRPDPSDDDWVFDDPGPIRTAEPLPPPPGHFPSTLEPRVRLDPPLPDLDDASNTAVAPPEVVEPEPADVVEVPAPAPSTALVKVPVDGHTNGNGHTNGEARLPAPAPAPAPPPPRPGDPLLGFEHFPDAAPTPEVRWG